MGTTLVTNDQHLIDDVEEIVIVADLVAALETVVDLAAARGEIVDDAADLTHVIVARNHAMRMKRNARDPVRPKRNDLDPALDPDLAPVKDLSFSTSKY